MTRGFWGIAIALLAAIGLAILATTPPGSMESASGQGNVSGTRAQGLISRIAAAPHPVGSEEHARVRSMLIKELEGMGLEVTTTTGKLGQGAQQKLDYWRGKRSETADDAVNIIGILPGKDRALPALLLMAHYDTVWGSPGASDDSTGVAAIVETVRAMAYRGDNQRDVIVLLSDAEELGLDGAARFFKSNPLRDRVGVIINLEARGGGGIASLFQLSPGNAEAIRTYSSAVRRPATSSFSAYIYSVLPNDTDLTEALNRGGYTAYNIAFIGRSGLYHSPLSTPANIDRGSVYHMLGQTDGLARVLASGNALPAQTENAVFFDVFGLGVAIYPPAWGWAMLVIGAIGLGLGWVRAADGGSLLSGAGRMLGVIVIGGVLLYLLNMLSGAGAGAGYYDRLAAIPKLTVMAGFACIAVILLFFGSTASATRTRIGAAIPLLLLGLAGQAIAPTAAYFVIIPVMLAGVVEGLRALAGDKPGMWAAVAMVAVVSGYQLALGYQIMQGVGPSMPSAVALPAALALPGWLTLWPGAPRTRWLAAVCLVAAIGMAVFVRVDPIPPTVAVYAPLKPS